jgi:hypothetical protein
MVALFEEGVEVLLPWSEVGALAPEEIGALDPEVRRASASGKDLYGALRQGVDTLADVGDRGAIVVLTDGGDRRLSPLWITDGDSEVLDPLFGLPDAAEAREFEETSALLASSGVRFFALAVGTGRTPSYDALAVSDLFPGADAFGAAYLDRVRARLEEWARVSHGQVYYRETLGDATGLYPAWLRRLAFRRRYTIRFAASVGQTGPTPEVRHPDPALRIEPIPTVDGAGSVR